MARNFPADVYRQKAMEESYDKEITSQLTFFRKMQAEGKDGSGPNKQLEAMRRKIAMAPKMRPAVQRGGDGGIHTKPKMSVDDELLAKVASLGEGKKIEEMRPPSAKTQKLLFDGISKEGKGKKQYLSARYKDSPADKFIYPILSSMEYGWKLDEVINTEDVKKPPHGRTRLVNDTFYTRNGIPMKHSSVDKASSVF